jgi:hypothetical protein
MKRKYSFHTRNTLKLLFLSVFAVSALWADDVTLDFDGINPNPYPVNLGDAYASLGISGTTAANPNAYAQAGVYKDALWFPLHGPGLLYVNSGFTGSMKLDYSGGVPIDPTFESPAVGWQILSNQAIGSPDTSNVLAGGLIPLTGGAWQTATASFEGTGYALEFGWLDGHQQGNAGDLLYDNIHLSLVGAADPSDPGTPSEVPEPPTWTLCTGFGLIACAARRFRTAKA